MLVFNVSPHRPQTAEGNVAENQDFLPDMDNMKTTNFTDVSPIVVWKPFPCIHVLNQNRRLHLFVFFVSLKGRLLLECQFSTWAMPSWAVAFWDWRTPWPTLGLSSSCESCDWILDMHLHVIVCMLHVCLYVFIICAYGGGVDKIMETPQKKRTLITTKLQIQVQ